MNEVKKLSIIAFSGDFDKLTAVFTLATGAAAVGYVTHGCHLALSTPISENLQHPPSPRAGHT